ncbi:unnamed protein product [Mytilus edulis]|uniref:Uncharacterized protein n=1 Tax=Mytilus edulis TaxID=6550 RepID=A0A8S3RUW1_MYTED|nr:unnamed protein product [Mytilus edulis]
MSDSGIMKPEGIPIRNVQEYTTHSWRSWKRKNVYLVNVTFFRQEKVKQVYVFRKSATKFSTFHSDKLLRESRRGLAIQNNTSYRNWCVLSKMLIVATSSNGQNAIFCVQVIETSGLSFISQDDLEYVCTCDCKDTSATVNKSISKFTRDLNVDRITLVENHFVYNAAIIGCIQ